MIPPKVLSKTKEMPDARWIEEDDRIIDESNSSVLDNENQFKFWLTNCSIRKAFIEIEQEIDTKKTQGETLSIRIVGWSSISKRALCDRNTLKHPLRVCWIEKRRKELLEKIEKKDEKKQIEIVKSNEEKLNEKIDRMTEELEKSKIECGKWFLKFQDALEEIKQLKNALLRQTDIGSRKDETILAQRNQIKELMSNKLTQK